MNKKILLLGGGGHCKSVLDSILEQRLRGNVAIVDDNLDLGSTLMGVRVVGGLKDFENFRSEGFEQAFITIGSIGNPQFRIELFNRLEAAGFETPNVLDKSSVVSRYALLGKGIFAGKNSVINAGASVGDGAIINTCVIVEHDGVVGRFAHISSACVLCGNVHIGESTHIGAGTVIRQGLTIGRDTTIGIGSVVTSSMPDGVIAFGSPCKVVKNTDSKFNPMQAETF